MPALTKTKTFVRNTAFAEGSMLVVPEYNNGMQYIVVQSEKDRVSKYFIFLLLCKISLRLS